MSLTVRDLHIEYPGALLFESLNLDVAEGEMVAVRTSVLDGGTSLLRGIGGFLNNVGGSVQLDDLDLLHCTPAERALRVGYVYEDHGLISLYTVYQNIVLPLQFHSSLSDAEIREALSDVCEALGLDDTIMELRPHEINDVQTRLVNLARALIVRPRLLLIDELEGGMSEAYLRDTMNTLSARQATSAMAIIITTSSDYVVENSDRVYRIDQHDLIPE